VNGPGTQLWSRDRPRVQRFLPHGADEIWDNGSHCFARDGNMHETEESIQQGATRSSVSRSQRNSVETYSNEGMQHLAGSYGRGPMPTRGRGMPLTPAPMLHLQRTAGNLAVVQLLAAEREESPVLDVVGKGGGFPLDQAVQADISRRLDADFSDVRIHTDAAAADSAAAVQAEAFTVGNESVFASSAHLSGTPGGKRTIAHELTHVIQQRNGEVGGTPTGDGISVPEPSDSLELAAEANADRVTTGAPGVIGASVPATEPGAIQRQTASDDSQSVDPSAIASPDVKLSFVPLDLFLKHHIPPRLAYAAAAHVFIEWNGQSAGFTREGDESITEASVRVPEPRVNDPSKQSVPATPINPISADYYGSLHSLVVEGSGANTYSLMDNNCETWARGTLKAAGLEAGPAPNGGGIGNNLIDHWQETPPDRRNQMIRDFVLGFGVADEMP
jgi:hypothetical protein